MRSTQEIYGESLDDLLAVIPELEYHHVGDGKVRIDSHHLPEKRIAPLVRALMRAEAELLVEMALANVETNYPGDKVEERRGEAFARVFRAAGLAEGERTRGSEV